MKQFQGKSGKFYVKNPFHDGAYSYAVYPSKDKYGKMLPIYTTTEIAFSDFDESNKEECYQFTVDVGGKSMYEFLATLTGTLIKPVDGITDAKQYLKLLIEKHGKNQVKYQYKKI